MIRIILTMTATIVAIFCASDLDGQYLQIAGLILSGFVLGGLCILSIPTGDK
jgi:hypothetical protein